MMPLLALRRSSHPIDWIIALDIKPLRGAIFKICIVGYSICGAVTVRNKHEKDSIIYAAVKALTALYGLVSAYKDIFESQPRVRVVMGAIKEYVVCSSISRHEVKN